MKHFFYFLLLPILCFCSLNTQAQVLGYNNQPMDSASTFHAYADTANRPVVYRLNRHGEGTGALLFSGKSGANFSVTINGTMLPSKKPVAIKANENNEYEIVLTRNNAKAEFIEAASIRVLENPEKIGHDLSFVMHSNKPVKRVFIESCMSVNCGFGVIAYVVHNEFSRMFPDLFNGVSLHLTKDPMNNLPYWEKLYDKKGAPSVLFNRDTLIRGINGIRPIQAAEPNGITLKIFEKQRKKDAFTGLIGSAAYKGKIAFDIRGAMTFYKPAQTADYKVGVAIIENDVQGKDESYAQLNGIFSDGSKGIMGGFENEPSIISYTLIKYQQVARGFLPEFKGQANLFPAEVKKGDRVEFALSLPFPESVDKRKNVRAILVVFNEKGQAINSVQIPILASFPVATEKIALPAIQVRPSNQGAIIAGATGKRIRIYSLKGTLLADRLGVSEEEYFSLPQGVAIVTAEGMAAQKIIVL